MPPKRPTVREYDSQILKVRVRVTVRVANVLGFWQYQYAWYLSQQLNSLSIKYLIWAIFIRHVLP